MRVEIVQYYDNKKEIQNVTIEFAVRYLSNYDIWKKDMIEELLIDGFEFMTPEGEYVKLIK